MELKHGELTDGILNVFYEIYNELGYGFLEKVYQNAVYIELKNKGYFVETQKKIKVFYKGNVVGEYYADLVVNDLVILELKAADYLVEAFEWQLINYLRGTDCEVMRHPKETAQIKSQKQTIKFAKFKMTAYI